MKLYKVNKDIIEEIEEKLAELPYELKDCFILLMNKERVDELIKRLDGKRTIFDISTYKGIPVYITEYRGVYLEVKPECILEVSNYEKTQITNFLKELEKICKKYNCNLGGCGCCGSPSIDNYYTLSVDNINFNGKELEYEIIERTSN